MQQGRGLFLFVTSLLIWLSASSAWAAVNITPRAEDQLHPAITHNNQRDEDLVVWEDESSPADFDIYGRRLGGDATPLGTPFSIIDSNYSEVNPVVVHNSVADEYLVVW